MSDKFFKPSTDRASDWRGSTKDAWVRQNRDPLHDFFIQKHEPEFNTAYDKGLQDSLHEEEK